MTRKLVLLGAGGHAASVLDCVDRVAYPEIIIVDLAENLGKSVLDLNVSHVDEQLPALFADGFTHAFVAVGSILNTETRRSLTAHLLKIGFTLPNIVAPSAVVSPFSLLSEGIFIGKNVVVNARASIAQGVILNTGAIIEHDCVVGPFCHVSVGSVLCGEVTLGSDVHIGANSVVKQGCTIGSHSILGMGSVLTHDLPSHVVAYGNPCKEVRSL
jgi:sugar O-acyltransferase (sialic acid O-acetyltransferase NeuD family)